MKGLESFPTNSKGNEMSANPERATRTPVSVLRNPREQQLRPSRWGSEDAILGQKLLDYVSENIDTSVMANFYAQISEAGRKCQVLSGSQTFKDLPPRLKSYLSAVNKEREKKQAKREESLKKELDLQDELVGIGLHDDPIKKSTDEWLANNDLLNIQPDADDAQAHLDALYRDNLLPTLQTPQNSPKTSRVLRR